MDAYDSPWKQVIEIWFEDFTRFFHPKLHEAIDWSVKPVALDKELETVVRDAVTGRRFADKLMKARLKNGEDSYIYAHFEVQADGEIQFPNRMFTYYHRLRDKYGPNVYSFGLLVDASKTWRPDRYVHKLLDLEVNFKFPTVKLLDYIDRWDELEASTNPFASVVMAHLKAKTTAGKPNDRLRWKLILVKRLYDKGYDKQAILNLFHFIDWVMTLPKDIEQTFKDEMKRFEGERKMRYVSSIERLGREEGLKKGLEKGLEKGREEGWKAGRKAGEEKGLHHALTLFLTNRFGPLPQCVEEFVETGDNRQLLIWLNRAYEGKELDAIFS